MHNGTPGIDRKGEADLIGLLLGLFSQLQPALLLFRRDVTGIDLLAVHKEHDIIYFRSFAKINELRNSLILAAIRGNGVSEHICIFFIHVYLPRFL